MGTTEHGKQEVYRISKWEIISAARMQKAPGSNPLNAAGILDIQQDLAKFNSEAANPSNVVDGNGEMGFVCTKKYGISGENGRDPIPQRFRA